MTVKKAEAAFERTLKTARRLLEVNAMVKWPAGAPARQQSLYRGVVVLTIGAWQGVVEDLAEASFEVTQRRARQSNIPLAALAGLGLDKFNTPNQARTRDLLGRAGLVLPASWTVTSARTAIGEQQAWDVIDAWLQVRHSIAHGFPFSESKRLENLLANHGHVACRVLTAKAPGRGESRVLTFSDTEGCMELISNVAALISAAAKTYAKA